MGSVRLLEVWPRPKDRCALAFLRWPRMSWWEIPASGGETLRITDEVAG